MSDFLWENTVKMHLIGGAILSALLAVVPVHPARAADAVPPPAPATRPAARLRPTGPRPPRQTA